MRGSVLYGEKGACYHRSGSAGLTFAFTAGSRLDVLLLGLRRTDQYYRRDRNWPERYTHLVLISAKPSGIMPEHFRNLQGLYSYRIEIHNGSKIVLTDRAESRLRR